MRGIQTSEEVAIKLSPKGKEETDQSQEKAQAWAQGGHQEGPPSLQGRQEWLGLGWRLCTQQNRVD